MMNAGFIGLTDYDWYRFLLGRFKETPMEEVNFWAPSKRSAINTIQKFDPFLFRLKKPYYAIAGFGFFRQATTVPLSLAWDLFGELNGVSSLDEMRTRIAKYRSDHGNFNSGVEIGCRTIVKPIFFDEDQWVEGPRDWDKNLVVGKTYSLTEGEGARIWKECLERALANNYLSVSAESAEFNRYGAPKEVLQRLGQGSFRVEVVNAYQRACAVTREHSLPVLEAGHIMPYALDGTHDVSNGILLRSDLHRLFDRGYVTVDHDYRFRVSGRLKDHWNNGKTYYALERKEIFLPKRENERPNRELLEWHRDSVFLG